VRDVAHDDRVRPVVEGDAAALAEHALHLVDERVVGAGVVDLDVLDAQGLELPLRVLGGPQRLALLLEPRHGRDAHDVPLAAHLEPVRAQHEVERLVPRDVDQVERHLPLHVVGGDDVQVAHVGQHAEHVLDVRVLEVERDALPIEGRRAARRRGRTMRLLRLGRGRVMRSRGRGRLGLQRRIGSRYVGRGWRHDLGHASGRGLGQRWRRDLGHGGWRRLGRGRRHGLGHRGHVRRGLDDGHGSGLRDRGGSIAELGDQHRAVGTHGMLTGVPAEVEHDAQPALVLRHPRTGDHAVRDRKAPLTPRVGRVWTLEVDHQPRWLSEQELPEPVGRTGERDFDAPARPCGLHVHALHGNPRRVWSRRCRGFGCRRVGGGRRVAACGGVGATDPIFGHRGRGRPRDGPGPRGRACCSQHQRQDGRLEPPHRFPLSAVRSSSTTSVGWCSP